MNAPPLARGRPVRLRYAHQGGRYPPLIVIHGNQVERLPDHYRRYLENVFRQALRLKGTPVKVEFRTGDNPFAGRRNLLDASAGAAQAPSDPSFAAAGSLIGRRELFS